MKNDQWIKMVLNCSLRASIAFIRCSIRARAARIGFSISSISSSCSRATWRHLRAWTDPASSEGGESWFMYHIDNVMFRLRTRLRDILNAIRGWEIASTNAIKGIGDELMQNERAEKERRKMKRMWWWKDWEESFPSLIIIYNNTYIQWMKMMLSL